MSTKFNYEYILNKLHNSLKKLIRFPPVHASI